MAAVGDVVDDDDNNIMQCTQHPFKNTSPSGGICAFCLQDKLGKLVSSSTSSSSSSSFLPLSSSSTTTTTTTTSLSLNHHTTTQPKAQQNLPFLLTPKKNKSFNESLVLKRSKSTTHYETSTPRRRGFWSFLHLPHKKTKPLELVVVEEKEETQTVIKPDNIIKNETGNETRLYQGKVTRSRSVGCGSRSFSGDLFERISTGFGDCSTLRRVESQREGGAARIKHRHSTSTAIREKVLCGGLFGGFMMITSSSSSTSTSSSSYWVTNAADNNNNNNNNATGRSKSWGWALASPRRAGKRETSNNGNAQTAATTTTVASDVSKTPNLAAIPSLLSVRS